MAGMLEAELDAQPDAADAAQPEKKKAAAATAAAPRHRASRKRRREEEEEEEAKEGEEEEGGEEMEEEDEEGAAEEEEEEDEEEEKKRVAWANILLKRVLGSSFRALLTTKAKRRRMAATLAAQAAAGQTTAEKESAAEAAAGDNEDDDATATSKPYVRHFTSAQPLTLRQQAGRRLAEAVMRHDGEGEREEREKLRRRDGGGAGGEGGGGGGKGERGGEGGDGGGGGEGGSVAAVIASMATLPRSWFGRELRAKGKGLMLAAAEGIDAAAAAHAEAEREAAEEAAHAERAKKAVFAIVMGNCSEDHSREWAVFWEERSGVEEEGSRNRGQERGAGWWCSRDDRRQRGSLAADLRLLVAGYLRGRHLARFVERQPGGLLGLMQVDVGHGDLGVPSHAFFHLLHAVMAQASLYVGAASHFEGTGCGCGCGSFNAHEATCRFFQRELTLFVRAVSGSDGTLHHALHWYGLTRVFNFDAPLAFPAAQYYRLVLDRNRATPFEFRLPYPLDAALIFPGASRGRWQQRFEPRRDVNLRANNSLAILKDRAGLVRADGDESFRALGGEQQLFSALSVLVKCAEAGRHHVAVFMGVWMMQHLWGVLQQPAKSPNYFFRKFKVDVCTRLAVALSAFYFRFDLPLSCLAMAEGTTEPVYADASPNPLANWWQMTSVRHAVLAAYKLHLEAAHLFSRNVGRLSPASLYYDDLVLTHVSSQLDHALDILLEMYTSGAMHKRCPAIQFCWDPKGEARTRLLSVLGRLKRTLHGRLAEAHVSQRVQVNARAVLNLFPLLEESAHRLAKMTAMERGTFKQERARGRAFVEAHCALGNSDDEDEDILAPGDDGVQLSLPLRVTFCQVVPLSGASTTDDRENYVRFVRRVLTNPSGPVATLLANTWWQKSRALADRMFAVLTFFALWQGPTQADDFWPSWPGNTPPPIDAAAFGDEEDAATTGADLAERYRRRAANVLYRLAHETSCIYQETSSGRHPRRFLLNRLLHYFHASQFVPSFGLDRHDTQTANRLVDARAHDFCFGIGQPQQGDRLMRVGNSEGHGQFMHHLFSRDRHLAEEVLDFGRDAVRYRTLF